MVVSSRHRWASVVAAAMVLLGACGSDDTDDASGPSASAGSGDGTTSSITATASGAVDGCEDALSDIELVDTADPPGRCEPGFPEPQPLDEAATIRMGLSSRSVEVFVPVLVALEAGEFERENLDVELHTVPSADSVQLLADGGLDVVVSSPHAGVLNGIAQGFDIRVVAGQTRQPEEMKSGLWVRQGITVGDLPGRRIGSNTGPGSNAFLALYEATLEAGVDFAAIDIQQIGGAQEIVTALKNGSIDGGIVSPPAYLELEADGGFDFLAPSETRGESGSAILFGPTMLENREVGEAFLRAYVRAVSTYFADDDYESDPEMVELMAAALDVAPDVVTGTPAYIADYEFHRGLVERLQRLYVAAGVTSYGEDEALTDSDVVDRSFLEAAVGAKYDS